MGKVRSLTACVLVTCAACTSFAETAECGTPRLLATAGAASEPPVSPPTIELWHPDGGTEVLSDDPAAYSPALSPDGDTVAIALGEGEWSDEDGWAASRVALLSVASGDVSLLSREVPGAEVSFLEWSSNGAEIAFLRTGPDGREIAAVDVDTGEERRVLPLGEGQGDFTWSPDGTEMLVPTRVRSEGTTGVELRRYFLGSGHHVVVTVEDAIRNPAWSPDGRWVAMQTFLPGTTQLGLVVLDDETGEFVPVDRRGGEAGPVTWSGPFLLYTYSGGPDGEPALMSWNSRTQRRAAVERDGLDRFLTSPLSAARCDSAAV
jgi:dipeptidyl aminopeptidase/acylaminoacyl peptidase